MPRSDQEPVTDADPEDPAQVTGDGAAGSRGAGVERKRSVLRTLLEWALVIGGSLAVALLIRTFLFATFWIPSGSMQPTLGLEDRVVVNKVSYDVHEVNRGDVIVFDKPESEPVVTADGRQVEDLIKRVVGLPGETITLREGDVLVEGRALGEPYLDDGTQTRPLAACGDTARFELDEDEVLVLGDNRTNSRDGRCFGPIEESSIVGRAFVRIWPLGDLTWL